MRITLMRSELMAACAAVCILGVSALLTVPATSFAADKKMVSCEDIKSAKKKMACETKAAAEATCASEADAKKKAACVKAEIKKARAAAKKSG